MTAELEALASAHALFGGAAQAGSLGAPDWDPGGPTSPGRYADSYRAAAGAAVRGLVDSRGEDAAFAGVLAAAAADHGRARHDTATVLAAARRDTEVPDNPIAVRELLRRRAFRLRAQRAHVLAAWRRALRHRATLRALRYHPNVRRGPGGGSRARNAVRAALSRLGCPYVWGATGPDTFDCSGLVRWAYAQAGVPLRRTTYDQINDGVPVARGDIRPGDLVFPHPGHVQMAIGGNLVVEAPQPGAAVQISALGSHVAIRRPG